MENLKATLGTIALHGITPRIVRKIDKHPLTGQSAWVFVYSISPTKSMQMREAMRLIYRSVARFNKASSYWRGYERELKSEADSHRNDPRTERMGRQDAREDMRNLYPRKDRSGNRDNTNSIKQESPQNNPSKQAPQNPKGWYGTGGGNIRDL